MQLNLHHLPNSRSQRIVWLLEELNLKYDLVIASVIQSSKAIHKYPYLIFTNHTGEVLELSETAAICQFLPQYEQQLIINPEQKDF